MIFKKFLVLFLLMISVPSQADLSHFIPNGQPEPGVGKWQKVPFGQMRILSCSTGVKDLDIVVGGVQVQLDPEWVMKKPILKPLTDKFPGWIEVPVRPGKGWNPTFRGDILFPLVYAKDPQEKADFELGVEGEFPVCKQENCINFPIHIALPLSSTEAEYTSVCAYLIEKQRQVPLPGDAAGVQGYAWREAGEVLFLFKGVNKANIAFLQTPEKKLFNVLETQVEENGIFMRVETEPWEAGKKKEWILVSDKGMFKVPVEMKNGPIALPEVPASWKIWLLGWELFFLTPLFIWWGLGIKQTTKAWKKALLKFMILFPIALILKVSLNQVIPFNWTYYALVLWGMVCLFPPLTNYAALIVFVLWPYFPDVPTLSVGLFFLWLCVMLLETMLPFVFLYFSAKDVGKILLPFKKNRFFTYNLLFLLPTVFLFGRVMWLDIQKQQTYIDELNHNGLSVVCSQKECSSWQEIQDIYFIAPKSVLGQVLQKLYKRSVVVIWEDKEGRFILAPNVSVKRAQTFIKNWKIYHAAGKP